MDGSAFNGLGVVIDVLVVAFVVCVPLAVWKLIDITIWIYHHVNIVFN